MSGSNFAWLSPALAQTGGQPVNGQAAMPAAAKALAAVSLAVALTATAAATAPPAHAAPPVAEATRASAHVPVRVSIAPEPLAALARQVQAGRWNTVAMGVIEGDASAVSGFGSTAGRPVDGDTLYAIGSVSKTFTALLLADAVQRGEMKLEQDAFGLLGWPGKGPRLVELATHTSGLPRLPSNMRPARMDNPYADYGPRQLEQGLLGWQAPGQPSAYAYSNLGYGLLGHVLTRKAGLDYGALVQQRIAAPLGMRDTGLAVKPGDEGRTAGGHGPDGSPVPLWTFDALAATGGLTSSVNDLMRYVTALMKAAPGTPAHMLQQVSRDGPDARTRIAMAWHRTMLPDGRVMVWHNGQTAGHASFVGWMEDGSRAVIVLVNSHMLVDGLAVQLLVNRAPLLAGAR